MNPAPPSPEVEHKLCLACGSKLPPNSIKCTECNTYQNWRRHLDFSGSILSLLVALVSVLGLTAPIFKDILFSKEAIINVQASSLQYQAMTQQQYLGKTGDRLVPIELVLDAGLKDRLNSEQYILSIKFVISNDGAAPAVITDVSVSGLSIRHPPLNVGSTSTQNQRAPAELKSRFKLVESEGQYGPVKVDAKSVKQIVGYFGPTSGYGPLSKSDNTPVDIDIHTTILTSDGVFKTISRKQQSPMH